MLENRQLAAETAYITRDEIVDPFIFQSIEVIDVEFRQPVGFVHWPEKPRVRVKAVCRKI